MARSTSTSAPEKVTLVSPDGEITRKDVVVGSKEEVSLRWDGFLPQEQQKLEAPERPTGAAPKTVGTNA